MRRIKKILRTIPKKASILAKDGKEHWISFFFWLFRYKLSDEKQYFQQDKRSKPRTPQIDQIGEIYASKRKNEKYPFV